MIVVGIIGYVSVGKTHIAQHFGKEGIPVFDADKIVHDLYDNNDELCSLLGKVFPQCIENNRICRKLLRNIVIDCPENLLYIEKIVHPFIAKERVNFLKKHKRRGSRIVVFDVPLLLEMEIKCDLRVFVSLNKSVWNHMATVKRNISPEYLKIISRKQWPAYIKRIMSDYVIHNGVGERLVHNQVCDILTKIDKRLFPKRKQKLINPLTRLL